MAFSHHGRPLVHGIPQRAIHEVQVDGLAQGSSMGGGPAMAPVFRVVMVDAANTGEPTQECGMQVIGSCPPFG